MPITKSREKPIFCILNFICVMHCLDLIFTGYDFRPTQKNLHIPLLMSGNNDIEQLNIVTIQLVLQFQMDLNNDVK